MLKKIITISVIAALFSSTSFAFGSKTEWTSGYGQGTTEYTVLGDGHAVLYFGCNPDSAAFSQFIDAKGNEYTSLDSVTKSIAVYAVIDGNEYIISDVMSNVGADNFSAAWNALRKGKKLIIKVKNYSDKTLSSTALTLKNAKKILPPFKDSDCKVGFDIP